MGVSLMSPLRLEHKLLLAEGHPELAHMAGVLPNAEGTYVVNVLCGRG